MAAGTGQDGSKDGLAEEGYGSHCLALPMLLEWAVPALRRAVWPKFINVVLNRRGGHTSEDESVVRGRLKFREEIAAPSECLLKKKSCQKQP